MHSKIRSLLLTAPVAILAACSSTPLPPEGGSTKASSYQQGVPGGVVVQTHTIIANVTDIDAEKRLVTLVNSEGKKTDVKCGPDVINFNQIHVGDRLKVEVTDQLVVRMAGPGESADDGAAGVVLLTPLGAKPGGVMAGTAQVTGTVVALDQRNHTATIQFADSSTRTFRVRSDVRLRDRKVGEKVVFRATETMALSVEKP